MPAGQFAQVDVGPVAGVSQVGLSCSGQTSAGRWSHEAGDIEPAPLCPLWSRRLREMTYDLADPALTGLLSLTLTHLI